MTTPQMSRFKKPLLTLAAACSAAVIVAGCSGADGQPTLAPAGSTANDDPLPPRTEFTGANLYIGVDDTSGTVNNFASFLSDNATPASTVTMDDATNEGIAINSLSDKLYRAGVTSAAAGSNPVVRLTCDAAFAASSFNPAMMGDPQFNREITLGGLAATPKGIALADSAGLIFVASNDGARVEVYSQSAPAAATPVATFTATGNPWDVVYDASTDRLFTANTNGSVDYFAGAAAAVYAGTAAAPTSSFNVAVGTANFHGIVYLASSDLLIVTDVGTATGAAMGAAGDGKIHAFAGASNLTGLVVPTRTVAGAATRLGDPVDLQVFGSTLLVAEKNNDAILEFPTTATGDVAPTNEVASTDPESLFYKSPRISPTVADATDFSGTAVSLLATAGSSVNFYELDLNATQGAAFSLPAGTTVQNINYNKEGDAFITFDDAVNGDGVLVVNRILGRSGDAASIGDADRKISNATTAFGAPKGIEVSIGDGLFMVADNDAANTSVSVFGLCQDGSTAPLFEVDVTDTTGYTAGLWDMDYDSGSDTLFVAGTNGQLLVYEDFIATGTDEDATGPQEATFVVTISTTLTDADEDGTDETAPTPLVNMHGVLVSGDLLIASDVGSAASDSDGQLVAVTLAFPDASETGPVEVTLVADLVVSGGPTSLGNPVDIAYDGTDLYVAEKASGGGQILLFEDFLDLDTVMPDPEAMPPVTGLATQSSAMPSSSTPLAGAESVALISDAAGDGP